ncbi:MAG: SCO family protein [Pseudomonadota bacterium]
MTRILLAVAAVIALSAFGLSSWILFERLTEEKTISGEGVIAVPANTGGPFELVSNENKAINQSAFKGKFALVYFGYSFCPDVCPTGLQNVAAGIDKAGAKADGVVPVFVTVDPERDTPDQLKQYVDLFHPRMVGLTGSEAQIKDVAKKFRVYYALRKDLDKEDYPVDHSSFTYLMDPDWKLIAVFRHNATPKNIADVLKQIL